MLTDLSAKAQSNYTGSRISSADATNMLEYHNRVRKEVGVGPLVWDNNIAAYAQRWADRLARSKCRITHRNSAEEEGRNYGENIFWGSPSSAYTPLDASIFWYEEKENYTYKRIGAGNWEETGHYTQMVWRNTKAFGAGVAICASGAIIVVANYDPPGNYEGEYPY